jgi:hypothetical protein
MTKGLSTKQRFVITKRELETLAAARAFPVGKRLTENTLVEFWVTTESSKNEDWAPEDLVVLELVS